MIARYPGSSILVSNPRAFVSDCAARGRKAVHSSDQGMGNLNYDESKASPGYPSCCGGWVQAQLLLKSVWFHNEFKKN
jgi:hypothetical protein